MPRSRSVSENSRASYIAIRRFMMLSLGPNSRAAFVRQAARLTGDGGCFLVALDAVGSASNFVLSRSRNASASARFAER